MESLLKLFQFLNFCYFSFCAFLIYKHPKNLPGEKFYLLFWESAALWWFFVMFPFSIWQFSLCAAFFGLQLFFGALYFFSQFEFSEKSFRIISSLIFVLILGYFVSLFGIKLQTIPFPTPESSTLKIEFPGQISSAYLFLAIGTGGLLLSSILIFKWIKEKKIDWNNLSRLYAMFGILVYTLLVLPNAFLIYQGPYYLLFYTTVPFLVFLAYGKKN